MLIGTYDIAESNARQWKVTFGHTDVDNGSEWIKGSPLPSFYNSQKKLKSIVIEMNVYGSNRNDIINNISTIISKLYNPVELTLDNYEHKFYGVMTRHSEAETVQDRWHKLTIDFACVEYGNTETQNISQKTSFVIDNIGNEETPVKITINPTIGYPELVINGLCRKKNGENLPIKIKDVRIGNPVIIDGEKGLITKNGIITSKNVELWKVPTLLAGQNEITTNEQFADFVFEFKPRFA